MTKRNPTVVVTADETLADVTERLRDAASGGRTVSLVVPIDSSLLLTAKEFRALKDAIDEQRLSVVMRTSDPLRLQLGERLGIRAQALPRPKAVKAVATLPPPLPLKAPDPAEEIGESGEDAIGGAVPTPDPDVHWPSQNGAEVAGAAESDIERTEPELASVPSLANPPRRWLPVVVFLVILVLAAVLAIRFVVPRAVVRIVPNSAPVTASLVFDVTADGQPLDGDAAFALKPQSRQLEVVWEGSASVTGVRVEPDGVASGPIELRNASAEQSTVDAGTIVVTETGAEFSFVDAVTVPPMDPATGEPGAATGSVQAVDAGSGGNIDTGELGGRLPNGVYYSNRMQPTGGGTDKEFPIVAQADLDALSAAAKDGADELAADVIAKEDQSTDVILSTVAVSGQQDEFDHQVNDEAQTVSLRSTLAIEATTYDKGAAEAEYEQTLAAQLANDAPVGFLVNPEQISFDSPVEVETADGGTRLEVVARVDAEAELDEAELQALAAKLAGASAEEAAAILAQSPEIAEYSVDYAPGWLPRQMPNNEGRIEFEFAR